jgi:hypothetical protein
MFVLARIHTGVRTCSPCAQLRYVLYLALPAPIFKHQICNPHNKVSPTLHSWCIFHPVLMYLSTLVCRPVWPIPMPKPPPSWAFVDATDAHQHLTPQSRSGAPSATPNFRALNRWKGGLVFTRVCTWLSTSTAITGTHVIAWLLWASLGLANSAPTSITCAVAAGWW